MKIKVPCQICGVNNWESLDYLRDQKYWYLADRLDETEPVGFKVCKNCGFITYDYIAESRLKEAYDRERGLFKPGSILFSNKKNLYHAKFLNDFIKEQKNFAFWNFLDVGCAQGSFLNWLREEHNVFKDNLFGTEWSRGYRAWGRQEYGLNLTENWPDTKKYFDFISYYHVLEHCQYPADELNKAISRLKPGGFIYISVPIWFHRMIESAGDPFKGFENYYHLNHVDVFTENSFENLLKVCGLKVIKKDRDIYGYTVLCQVDAEEKKKPFKIDDIDNIKQELEQQKAAAELYMQKKHEDAIKAYPKFVDAYMSLSLSEKYMRTLEGQKSVLDQGLSVMPDSLELLEQLGCVYFQFDQNIPDKPKFYSNNIKKAEELLEKVLSNRPSGKAYFFLSLINGVYKKDYQRAIELMKTVKQLDPSNFNEPNKWLSKYYYDLGK